MVAAAAIAFAISAGRAPAQQEGMAPTPMATAQEAMELPTVALYADPNFGPAPFTVGFLPTIHDPLQAEIVSYRWNFGDGHVATTSPLQTFNTYITPGTYVASLTIATADGRSATGFASVMVTRPLQAGQ